MTVGTTVPFVQYVYTGPGNYSFNFKVIEEEDIDVKHVATDGTITQLVLTTDYTVNIATPPAEGGSIDTTYAPTTGNLQISRIMVIDQQTDWVNNDPFDMEILERAEDKGIMIDQQQQEELDRTIRVAPGEPSDYVLPSAEADKYFGWDASVPPIMVNKDYPLLTGDGPPDTALGDNGGLYLDKLNGVWYNKVAGSWNNIGNAYGQGVPSGGGADQVLVKDSAADFDTKWDTLGSLPGGGTHNEATARDVANCHPAESISYDNTTSGLASTDVQNAIDEAITVSGVGTVRQTIRTTADLGWILLKGETLGNASSGADHANAMYSALFELVKLLPPNLGTEVFANNDTVVLPDVRGKVVAMLDASNAIGTSKGSETHLLTEAEIPAHNHAVSGNTESESGHTHNYERAENSTLYSTQTFDASAFWGNDSSNVGGGTPHLHAINLTSGSKGGGGAHNNVQPTIYFNVEIKY